MSRTATACNGLIGQDQAVELAAILCCHFRLNEPRRQAAEFGLNAQALQSWRLVPVQPQVWGGSRYRFTGDQARSGGQGVAGFFQAIQRRGSPRR